MKITRTIRPTTVAALFTLFLIFKALWPLAILWVLNTLFGAGLAYSFLNWLAALVLWHSVKYVLQLRYRYGSRSIGQ